MLPPLGGIPPYRCDNTKYHLLGGSSTHLQGGACNTSYGVTIASNGVTIANSNSNINSNDIVIDANTNNNSKVNTNTSGPQGRMAPGPEGPRWGPLARRARWWGPSTGIRFYTKN